MQVRSARKLSGASASRVSEIDALHWRLLTLSFFFFFYSAQCLPEAWGGSRQFNIRSGVSIN